ncbi:CatA-like O-acetyltransferase [Phocaeicola plebeius]|uniref:CatA-like O-acetyltransferase n=1 Tax=Phocaeicola plebeius TaxID=310297 RepID=UPI00350E333C
MIDKDVWERTSYFDYYFNQIRCSYSIIVNIDISKIIFFKNRNHTELYPLLTNYELDIEKCLVIIMVWMQKQIHQPISFLYPHCHGLHLPAST